MTLDKVLEHRHIYKVRYGEPWPGLTADSQDISCHVTITMSVHDAVNFSRKSHGDTPVKFSDRDLLCDFIVIHFADVIDDRGNRVEGLQL